MKRHTESVARLALGPTLAVGLLMILLAANAHSPEVTRSVSIDSHDATPILMDQIGAAAQKQYSGDGLSVTPTKEGALLRCVFQRLDGEATKEGLWLSSTVPDQTGDRFRVKAMAVGQMILPERGVVSVDGQSVRFSRPGLVEEYSVSMDGVRQDFVVMEKPVGASVSVSRLVSSLAPPTVGELRVELSVTGAKVEQTAGGAKLMLEKSGRKIAYSRLKVMDAHGRELPARIEVSPNSALRTPHSESAMAVVVDDVDAIYPLRIDPTFSDENWISVGGITGVNGTVYAAVVDGAGNLYIGGDFGIVGDLITENVAKWDGNIWSALGLGLGRPGWADTVYTLAVSGNTLYAGGLFQTITNSNGTVITANNISKWDGTNWSALGNGMNERVTALAVSGGDLYAGGYFWGLGQFVAKWNGSYWSGLGEGIGSETYNVYVNALAISGSDLYVGGNFTKAGGGAVTNVAKWNGTSWSGLGPGLSSQVRALAVSGGDLYVGGDFLAAGGVSTGNFIAKWDGSSWSALGAGVNGSVRAITVSGTNLYLGGDFTSAGIFGEASASRVAKWDGSNWSSIGAGTSASVNTLVLSGSTLYVGGNFVYVTNSGSGAVQANRIAVWDGNGWSHLAGSGVNDQVYTLVFSGSDLFAGGDFTTIGSISANRVAKWDGTNWSALGTGMNNRVYSLAVSGSNLFAGGLFTTAGGSPASRVARWDGTTWTTLAGGVNNAVFTVGTSGSNLFVGGNFSYATNAGAAAVQVNRIAKWDGIAWSQLGSGVNNTAVNELAVSSAGDLYIGGDFTTAGGSPASRIAKWNGTNWLALGAGMNNAVTALAISGNELIAGGLFTYATNAGPTPVQVGRIAKWDGTNWSGLAGGMNGAVYVLARSGADLYAGGDFTSATNAGSSTATTTRIAKWDGSNWSALGTGMNSSVNSLAILGNNLYVGGAFTTAGGKVSAYMARAILQVPPISIITSDGSFGLTNGTFGFGVSAAEGLNLIIEGSTNLTDWFPLQTNVVGLTPLFFSDSQWTNYPARFYRIRSP